MHLLFLWINKGLAEPAGANSHDYMHILYVDSIKHPSVLGTYFTYAPIYWESGPRGLALLNRHSCSTHWDSIQKITRITCGDKFTSDAILYKHREIITNNYSVYNTYLMYWEKSTTYGAKFWFLNIKYIIGCTTFLLLSCSIVNCPIAFYDLVKFRRDSWQWLAVIARCQGASSNVSSHLSH